MTEKVKQQHQQTVAMWLPMGQRILKGRYRSMTDNDIHADLGDKKETRKSRGGGTYDVWLSEIDWTPLDKWMEPIPSECLAMIAKAHDIGFDKMMVCKLEDKELDPIVVAEWNNDYWFITRWE